MASGGVDEGSSRGDVDPEWTMVKHTLAKMASGEVDEGSSRGNVDPEWTMVADLRALVESRDPSAKDVDDFTLRRFLRARDQDLKKASQMFLKYLAWRAEAVPNGFISANEVVNEVNQKYAYMQGYDKLGRPILVVFAGRRHASGLDVAEFKRYIVYFLDKLCNRLPRGQEKFVIIGDMEGWGYANFDFQGYISAINILQSYYPERLGKACMVHVPFIFMQAWKIVSPFIDAKTKEKFHFIENKDLETTLLSYIDEDQLPEIYGGKLPLVPVEDA